MIFLVDKVTKNNFNFFKFMAFFGFKFHAYEMNSFEKFNTKAGGYLVPINFTKRDNIGLIKTLYFKYKNKNPFEEFLPKNIEHILIKYFPNIDKIKAKILHTIETKFYSYSLGILIAFSYQESQKQKSIIIHNSLISYFTRVINPSFNYDTFHIYFPLDDILNFILLAFRLVTKILFSGRYLLVMKVKKISLIHKNKKKNIKIKQSIKNSKVAIIFHSQRNYGSKLYEKDHYFSSSKSSPLHKENLVCYIYNPIMGNDRIINKKEKSLIQDIILSYKNIPLLDKIRSYLISVKLLYILLKHIKNYKQLIGIAAVVLLFRKFYLWKKYFSECKFKNVIIDYDINFSKSISLALQSLSINTIAICERPVLLSLNPWGIIVNKYLLPGKLYEKYAIANPSYIFDSSYNLGLWRTKYFYKCNDIDFKDLHFINPFKSEKKFYQYPKFILFIGTVLIQKSPGYYFNQTFNEKFFSIISNFATNHPDKAIILRMKSLNKEESILINNRFRKIPNFFLCDDYDYYGISYILCKKADLIIAHPTTLADEAIAFGKHVLLLDDLFTINPYSSYLYPKEFYFAIPKDDAELNDLANKILSYDRTLLNKFSNLKKLLSGDIDLSNERAIPDLIEKNLVEL